MAKDSKQIVIEGAKLIFKNFEGKEGPFNMKGSRNFSVVLPPEYAEQLLQDGWNVKFLEPREEGDTPTPYLGVAVNFQNRPPRVVMISGTRRTNLTEKTVEVLDWADISNVDLIITPYEWTVNDKSGIKAYLKSLYVTIEEDELERKYAEPEPDA
jgi:hypothetical protein